MSEKGGHKYVDESVIGLPRGRVYKIQPVFVDPKPVGDDKKDDKERDKVKGKKG